MADDRRLLMSFEPEKPFLIASLCVCKTLSLRKPRLNEFFGVVVMTVTYISTAAVAVAYRDMLLSMYDNYGKHMRTLAAQVQ